MKNSLLPSMILMSSFVMATAPQAAQQETIKLDSILHAIDSMDPTQFAKLLTDNSKFKFGNFPEAVGKEAIAKSQTDFYSSIKGLKHEVVHSWHDKSSIVAEMNVTYTRHDGSTITLPVTDVFKIKDNKVAGTYIYMDITPLYAPK
ncbi:nuclear transport factor 2 family protein [Serratia sp. DD3]|uniref:nuclear transport factor 2 family protein n=1 Tax=Serratia sp. DD3 TaxID=1410619 RepID=UPI0003C4FDEE|nr:nuclear transport factor 2 family protein [Serratia sp. DD3]KEY57633.1 limonene-1,2-epoxide hydrolase [Serratia sp. DD3]